MKTNLKERSTTSPKVQFNLRRSSPLSIFMLSQYFSVITCHSNDK